MAIISPRIVYNIRCRSSITLSGKSGYSVLSMMVNGNGMQLMFMGI